MKVGVTGGRDFTNRVVIFGVLDDLHAISPISELVHGDARGVDTIARDWAHDRGVNETPFPADWQNLDAPGAVIKCHPGGQPYNALAGFTRNQAMVDYGIEVLVAFPGNRGTRDMRRRATAADVLIIPISTSGKILVDATS